MGLFHQAAEHYNQGSEQIARDNLAASALAVAFAGQCVEDLFNPENDDTVDVAQRIREEGFSEEALESYEQIVTDAHKKIVAARKALYGKKRQSAEEKVQGNDSAQVAATNGVVEDEVDLHEVEEVAA